MEDLLTRRPGRDRTSWSAADGGLDSGPAVRV